MKKVNLGWHKKDEFGFWIWETEDHFKWWDEKKTRTFEQLLLDSKFDPEKYKIREDLGPDFRIADDEIIYGYSYGGPLSGRGGYFVVKKNQPLLIIRHNPVWLS